MAGIFYPEESKAAEAVLAGFEAETSAAAPAGSALALIAPHAGWELSGRLASAAFAAAAGRKVSTVVLLGPIHGGKPEGVFLTESEYFETPIGDVPVDSELCGELESCGTLFVTNDIPHLEEHSIEVLLPFVKRAFPSASIVPILVSGSRVPLVRTLSRGLDLVFGPIADSTLFVVSTNMCANLPPDAANAHADHFADLIAQGNPEPLLDALNGGTVSACGGALCAALMGTATLGIGTPVLIASAESSGRPDHDARRLVRYAAYAYY